MNLLKNLNFNLIIIYIVHKNKLNYLKGSIFECFFKKYNRCLCFYLINFFSKDIIMESFSL